VRQFQSTRIGERGSGDPESLIYSSTFPSGFAGSLMIAGFAALAAMATIAAIWLIIYAIPKVIAFSVRLDQDPVNQGPWHSGEPSNCPECQSHIQSHFWLPDDSALLGSFDRSKLASLTDEHWQQVNAMILPIPSSWG
jgi:hypothetical protein